MVTARLHLGGVLLCAAAWVAPAAAHSQPVRSLKEIRTENVVIQKWDVSCGAAALATLLTYQHGYPIDEERAARGMLKSTDPLRVKYRGGFSLLDLKRFAQAQGFEADAYTEMDWDSLEQMKPAIVPVIQDGYPHFVIYRGKVGDSVLLADPAFGNRVLPADRFESMWQQNMAFVVQRRDGTAPPNRLAVQRADFVRATASALRQAIR